MQNLLQRYVEHRKARKHVRETLSPANDNFW